MTPTQFEVKKDEALPTVTPDKPFDDILKDSNGNIISQPEPIVNTEGENNIDKSDLDETKYSLSTAKAVDEKRILSYDKEKGSVLSVIAQHARLGNITEASLNDSISRFKRFVNDFLFSLPP